MKCEVCNIYFNMHNEDNVGFLGIRSLLDCEKPQTDLNLDNYFCLDCANKTFKELEEWKEEKLNLERGIQ